MIRPTWLVLLSGATLAAQTPVPDPQPPSPTMVVMLGTGTPNPDPDHSGPSVAIVVNHTAYLVDAGAGIMRRAEQARRLGIDALSAEKPAIVFLTHLHSDHTIGLPDLIHTGWVMGRGVPLKVLGPTGTVAMTGHLTEAWAADIANRTGGLQPHTENGWKVEAQDIGAGEVYRDSNITVTAIPVAHDGWASALGYRFETRDRVIVVSGDTRPTDAVADACNGCDVLVHEVYSPKGLATRTPVWQAYHRDAHTSTAELAAVATRAHPKLLLLYHQLYWGVNDEGFLLEIRQQGYSGAVVSARDLGIY